MQVDLDYIKTYREAPSRYYYVLSAFDIDDIWMVDFSNREIYMNKGTTLYESSGTFAPLSDESLALWFLMVEAYFDFND